MKGLHKLGHGAENAGIREVSEPAAAAGELKIKVHAAGICGTDIHIMLDEYPSSYPVILGHEFSGIVEAVGEGVQDFKPGDRVVSLTAVVTCGHCRYCYEGLLMLCEERLSIGSGVNGAMAEYVVVPSHLAFKIPEGVSLDEAALCEPLACVVRSVIERATVKAGDYVLVSGPGTIGLLTLQLALASGGKVVVTGTGLDKERLKLAADLGALAVINVAEEDVAAKVAEITKGAGFDVAFECAGAAPSADACLRLLKKTGLYVQVGLYGKRIEFDMDLALKKEIAMTNSYASERTSWVRALRMLEYKQVDVKPLISARLPLSDWKKGFTMAINKEGYKILLQP
ncbi:MAG: zinc-binding dehydrogenase [Negativicutes bacterium]|nr:zinc-binding dehydrogenase [Negativicutes bacterium]